MKKNVASQVIGAQMVSATDGSAFTGSVTVYVTIDGGTQAVGTVGSGACTHEGNGFHTYAPSQAETNGNHIGYTFIGTGAVPSTIQVYTTFPQTVDNATNISAIKTKTDFLPSVTAGGSGGLLISGSNTGTTTLGALTITGATIHTGATTYTGAVTASNASNNFRINGVAPGASGGVFIAGTNAATSVTTALTANITGNLSGSVGSVTGAVGSVTGNVGGNVTGSVGSVTGLTNATIADQVWDEAIAGHATSGSTGEALSAAGGAGDPWITSLPGSYTGTQAGKILADVLVDTGTTIPAQLDDMSGATFDTATDSLEAIRNRGDAAWITGAGGSAPTVGEIAAAVWDEALSGHVTAGTAGKALVDIETDAAAILVDTGTTIPGTIATVDANVDAILVDTGTTLPATLATIDANVDAVLVDTGTDIPASIAAVPTATENADALLNRDMSAVSDTNARTPLNAMRFLRNKYSISGTTLTVTKEDDTTSAWTSTLTTNASAEPVTGSDPA